MRRRIVVRIGVFLLLGAIVNIAMAWAAAIWLPAGPGLVGAHEQARGGVVCCSFIQGGVAATSIRTSYSTVFHLENELGPGFPTAPLPGWCMDPCRGRSLRELEHTQFIQVAWGWPRRSMACWIEEHIEDVPGFVRDDPPMIPGLDVLPQPGGTRWVSEASWRIPLAWLKRPEDGSVPIVSGSGGLRGMPRCLPLRVLPAGFAVNTFFYAAILWLVFAAPFETRRLMRKGRDRCPHCGYPIGSNELCTECGKPVAARPGRTKRAGDAG